MNLKEAAKLLNTSRTNLSYHVAQNHLQATFVPATKPGEWGHYEISGQQIEDFKAWLRHEKNGNHSEPAENQQTISNRLALVEKKVDENTALLKQVYYEVRKLTE